MPATFKANKRCYNRRFGLYGLETLNHRSELKILWDTFRSQNFGFHMIAGSQTIADDRRRSQKIEPRSIFWDRLRSSAITIAGSQAIAEVCFHMIADDRRTFCDLRSAIVCYHMETSLYALIRCSYHFVSTSQSGSGSGTTFYIILIFSIKSVM